MAGTADLIITRQRDAIHTPDPERAPRLGDFARGVNGSPGYTRCGRPAAVAVNDYAAAQLYPTLEACPVCVRATPVGELSEQALADDLRAVYVDMTVPDGTLTMAQTVALDRRKHALRLELEQRTATAAATTAA